jgi:hypothetical protein
VQDANKADGTSNSRPDFEATIELIYRYQAARVISATRSFSEFGQISPSSSGSEPYHPYGYIDCLLFMLAVAIFQIVYFKKKRWL